MTNEDMGKPFRLRNYRSSWEEGTGCKIWQAAQATAAAPLYFPPVRFGTPPANYVDGGLTYNNPVRALFDEARHVWPGPGIWCIISIGTGVPPIKPTGKTGKQIIESVIHIATDTQQTADEFSDEMDHLKRAKDSSLTCIRLNVDQGLQTIRLEEWKDFDRLTGATNHYLNTRKGELERGADALCTQGGM